MSRTVIALSLVGVLLAGCRTDAPRAPVAAESAPVLGVAVLAPTQGNAAAGEIQFRRIGSHVRATGRITGLTPGSTHGFHIHQNGDCSAVDGSSAGGHFNPAAVAHGRIEADPHHAGDMPNLQADAQGVAVVDGPLSPAVSIGDGGAADILGRGLIVHADADDYATQPTGNAGARLACAVITPAG